MKIITDAEERRIDNAVRRLRENLLTKGLNRQEIEGEIEEIIGCVSAQYWAQYNSADHDYDYDLTAYGDVDLNYAPEYRIKLDRETGRVAWVKKLQFLNGRLTSCKKLC